MYNEAASSVTDMTDRHTHTHVLRVKNHSLFSRLPNLQTAVNKKWGERAGSLRARMLKPKLIIAKIILLRYIILTIGPHHLSTRCGFSPS